MVRVAHARAVQAVRVPAAPAGARDSSRGRRVKALGRRVARQFPAQFGLRRAGSFTRDPAPGADAASAAFRADVRCRPARQMRSRAESGAFDVPIACAIPTIRLRRMGMHR
ncbi:hypothetical protein GCM10007067_03150 [Lysobacter bugurensis]|uniref:Uncharacterized protein n=1 Tax=Cognatilysobacter bugurensis TaxID=543356 RepID=A0A918ST30_9GAMM|nr:hypothetical protein GCM10007067_03150 [Lysobacter bugurensis]